MSAALESTSNLPSSILSASLAGTLSFVASPLSGSATLTVQICIRLYQYSETKAKQLLRRLRKSNSASQRKTALSHLVEFAEAGTNAVALNAVDAIRFVVHVIVEENLALKRS